MTIINILCKACNIFIDIKSLNKFKDRCQHIFLCRYCFKSFDLEADENGEFEYVVNDDITLKFTYPTSNDVDQISETETVSKFLEYTIRQVNDSRSKPEIRDFIKYNFLAKDSKKFRSHVNDNAPGLNYEYEFEGENGSTFTAMFQVRPDFFWF